MGAPAAPLQDSGIPYGIALAAGALLVYPHTVWFARLGPLGRQLTAIIYELFTGSGVLGDQACRFAT